MMDNSPYASNRGGGDNQASAVEENVRSKRTERGGGVVVTLSLIINYCTKKSEEHLLVTGQMSDNCPLGFSSAPSLAAQGGVPRRLATGSTRRNADGRPAIILHAGGNRVHAQRRAAPAGLVSLRPPSRV